MSPVLRIQGKVTKAGEPAEGAYVGLIDPEGLFVAERRTAEDGAYSFHTTPGSWTLSFRAAGARPIELTVSGESEETVDVDLPEA
jgi:hypothetical protein